MKLFDKTWKLALSGVVIGLLVMLLAMSGNPANMAICVACFIRDAAGALKLHTAAPVQYFRPEIVGFVCGSFLISMATKEYRSTAGSAPMVRFLLGTVMMIGALVFLGCPLRMVLRMSAGDLNAYVALIGFAGGVATGSCFLKKGFSLGRAYETKPLSGAVLPVLLAALLVIGVATGAYAASTEGPGSKHAPVILSLVAALIIGDAAIATGLLSTPVILIAAVASIAVFVVPSLYEMATAFRFLVLLAAGVAGPVGLVCAALVVLLALAQVSALGVPYCAPVRFPQTALSPDGVTRRTYRTLSAHPFSIWQKRR